jgi:hypothetical protein
MARHRLLPDNGSIRQDFKQIIIALIRPLFGQVGLGCHDRVTGCCPTLTTHRTAGLHGQVGAGRETEVTLRRSGTSPRPDPGPFKTGWRRTFSVISTRERTSTTRACETRYIRFGLHPKSRKARVPFHIKWRINLFIFSRIKTIQFGCFVAIPVAGTATGAFSAKCRALI